MKILFIYGHPRKESFCSSLSFAYKKGAEKKGAEVRECFISDLSLSKWLSFGHNEHPELSEDLKKTQEDIVWADKIVFSHPVWWGGVPAQTKLFLEILFQPGFSFKYHEKGIGWDKLLKGKSAHIIATMDTPPFIYKIFIGDPSGKMLKISTLGFCGISPIKKTYIGSIKLSSKEKKEKWLSLLEKKGEENV
jgi:NAD(P)H dehydrogenase (quinone)